MPWRLTDTEIHSREFRRELLGPAFYCKLCNLAGKYLICLQVYQMNQRWVGAEASWRHPEIVRFHSIGPPFDGHQSFPLKSVLSTWPLWQMQLRIAATREIILYSHSKWALDVHENRSFLEYINLAVKCSAMAEEVDPLIRVVWVFVRGD